MRPKIHPMMRRTLNFDPSACRRLRVACDLTYSGATSGFHRNDLPMTSHDPQQAAFTTGQRLRLPRENGIVVLRGAVQRDDGLDLFVANDIDSSEVRMESLTSSQVKQVRIVEEDGAAAPEAVLGDC